MNRLEVRSKVWLEVEGEPLLGEGREKLLRLIGHKGSISAAAKAMGITYRKAWSHLESMERRLSFPLVTRRKGGARGGRTTLTCQAKVLLDRFGELKGGVQEFVDDKFAAGFRDPETKGDKPC